MEEKKETQVSTEQYYANVEGISTPVEPEEQTYSLEDLHPEEPKEEKVVAPVAAPNEEIQPDPTVIDGVKETIGDSSATSEQSIQQSSFSQNTLEPKPVVSTIPKPQIPTTANVVPQAPVKPIKVNKPQAQNEVPNAKIFYLIFGAILLLVIVGLPLYSSINSALNPTTGVSEPVTNDENKTNPTPEEKPTTNQPTTGANEIVFDMSLGFDKGWVTNEKEINQKTGFLPTNLTGVIRCDLERPVVMEGITMYASTYLYYQNYKIVSAITVTKHQYGDQTSYTANKDATSIYQNAGDTNDSLDVKIIQDDNALTVTNIMQYNLQYGHTTYVEELETHLQFSSQFGTNIKTAIEQALITGANSGNAVCGAILTNDAGV